MTKGRIIVSDGLAKLFFGIFFLIYVDICPVHARVHVFHVYDSIHAHVYTCVHACGGKRLMPHAFIGCTPACGLRQSLPLEAS